MISLQKMEKHRKITDPGCRLWALYSFSLKFIANNSKLYWNYQMPLNKHWCDWLSLTHETDFLYHQNSALRVEMAWHSSWVRADLQGNIQFLLWKYELFLILPCSCSANAQIDGLDYFCPLWWNSQIKTFTVTHFRSSHGSQEERDSCLYSYTPRLHLFEKVVLSGLIFGAALCKCFGEKDSEKVKSSGWKKLCSRLEKLPVAYRV